MKIYGKYFILVSLFINAAVFALKSDHNLPATFIADLVNYNNKTAVTFFTGHVKMDQGTTHLTGDEVTVENDSGGKVAKVIDKGHQAHYSTLPDGQEEIVDAYADTIEYYPQKGIAILISNAKVTQGKNSFTGPKIIYDIKKQVVLSTPTSQAVQSVIILQPQDLPGSHKTQLSKVDSQK